MRGSLSRLRQKSSTTGSSPRVRGSQYLEERDASDKRIIPAGAGLTLRQAASRRLRRDHPRGCGAHWKRRLERASARGSSPRVRGSRIQLPGRHWRLGIIPAGAGLTHRQERTGRLRRDHPRGCGAHREYTLVFTIRAGSSPRVRGSRGSRRRARRRLGIIPAGAGLTRFRPDRSRSCRDHPRGCGAHVMHHSQKAACMGSSPRVRGSLLPRRFAAASTGIIPAGAGLTTPSKVNPLAFRDHPRGCGAHRLIHDYFSSSEGSSPRVRGSQVGRQRFDLRTGIIPAGAGLTRQSGLQLRTRRDHPRGCGAHDFFIDATRDITGSSPRVRGSQRAVYSR